MGILAYVFYQYAMYAMSWAVGPLLLVYMVIYGLSLVGIAVVPAVKMFRTIQPGGSVLCEAVRAPDRMEGEHE